VVFSIAVSKIGDWVEHARCFTYFIEQREVDGRKEDIGLEVVPYMRDIETLNKRQEKSIYCSATNNERLLLVADKIECMLQ
jgi:hypothetical protein